MSGAVRIGVAGAGLIGRKHIELIATSPDCVLAGIADPSPEAKELAELRGIPWYGDHRALLERETPDGMIVASPNALHLPMALDCVARGVPVLIEKPVTDMVASAQRLCEAVRRSGVPVLVGHHRRHNPRIKAIRDNREARTRRRAARPGRKRRATAASLYVRSPARRRRCSGSEL